MPFDWGQCQIPYPSPGPKGWGFQLTGALVLGSTDKDTCKELLFARLIRGGRNRVGRREKWPKQKLGGGRNRGEK